MLTHSYNPAYTRALIRNGKKPYKRYLYNTVKDSLEYRIEEQTDLLRSCKYLDKIFGVNTIMPEQKALGELKMKVINKMQSN